MNAMLSRPRLYNLDEAATLPTSLSRHLTLSLDLLRRAAGRTPRTRTYHAATDSAARLAQGAPWLCAPSSQRVCLFVGAEAPRKTTVQRCYLRYKDSAIGAERDVRLSHRVRLMVRPKAGGSTSKTRFRSCRVTND